MQTFLSEDNVVGSVAVLDSRRLAKQYLEGWQILDAIAKTPGGGGTRVNGRVPFASNHPATNQWRGHEGALASYLMYCEVELDERGIDTAKVKAKIEKTMTENRTWKYFNSYPDWYLDSDTFTKVMNSHRHSLYNKDPEHYAQYAQDAAVFADALVRRPWEFLCCKPGKHKPYFYPSHKEK